jgi:hypothetical protein
MTYIYNTIDNVPLNQIFLSIFLKSAYKNVMNMTPINSVSACVYCSMLFVCISFAFFWIFLFFLYLFWRSLSAVIYFHPCLLFSLYCTFFEIRLVYLYCSSCILAFVSCVWLCIVSHTQGIFALCLQFRFVSCSKCYQCYASYLII